MTDIFKLFFEKFQLYPWHIHVGGAMFIAALGAFFWYAFWGFHKYTNTINKVLERENRINDLHNKIEQEKETNKSNFLVANQVLTALFNVKSFVETINEIRLNSTPEWKTRESLRLIQKILDQLSNDVKTRGGALHRCGIYIISDDEKTLTLQFTSFGFPRYYRGNRQLDVHDSAAGKTFIRKQKQNIPDVKANDDWKPSPYHEEVRYTSLICIPLGAFGVLTIDGEEPMSEECELIGEVYAALIESAVIEHDEGYATLNLNQLVNHETDELSEDDIENIS